MLVVGTPGLVLLVPLGYCQGFDCGLGLTLPLGHCQGSIPGRGSPTELVDAAGALPGPLGHCQGNVPGRGSPTEFICYGPIGGLPSDSELLLTRLRGYTGIDMKW
jgi:hypothetical protein